MRLRHSFEVNGKYFSEVCKNTYGKPCPVCKEVSSEWKAAFDEGGKEYAKKTVAIKFKKEVYITNILVLEDPAHPENEGKVFLYYVNNTISKLIDEMRTPDDDDPYKKLVNVQDYYDGAVLKIEIYKKSGYHKYDKCKFLTPSELYDGDEEKIQEVHSHIFDLNDFVSEEKNFKSDEELMVKYRKICGIPEPKIDKDSERVSEEMETVNDQIEEMMKGDSERSPFDEDSKDDVPDVESSFDDEEGLDDFISNMGI